jgi:hypothetical protein
MGADPGQAAFAFLASREGPFDDPAEFFSSSANACRAQSRGDVPSPPTPPLMPPGPVPGRPRMIQRLFSLMATAAVGCGLWDGLWSPVVGAQPESAAKRDAADCVRAWRARAKMVPNLRVSWKQTETIVRGTLRPRPFDRVHPPKDVPIPPVDTTLHGTFRTVLSAGKIRYEEKTDSFAPETNTIGVQQDVRVYDGRSYGACFTGNVGIFPIGEIQSPEPSLAVTRERNIVPLSLFFRILDPPSHRRDLTLCQLNRERRSCSVDPAASSSFGVPTASPRSCLSFRTEDISRSRRRSMRTGMSALT